MPIIENFHKRLSFWKSKSLSFGGRLTLIKSVLGSLGSYYFSTFKAPVKVINKLEGLRRNFFWGGSLKDRKIAWVAWKKVLSPLKFGGLGIGSLKSCNQAWLAKWWWRFHLEPHNLWCKIIKSIHGEKGGLNSNALNSVRGITWNHIIKLQVDLSKFNINLSSLFKLKVGNGNDVWLGGSGDQHLKIIKVICN